MEAAHCGLIKITVSLKMVSRLWLSLRMTMVVRLPSACKMTMWITRSHKLCPRRWKTTRNPIILKMILILSKMNMVKNRYWMMGHHLRLMSLILFWSIRTMLRFWDKIKRLAMILKSRLENSKTTLMEVATLKTKACWSKARISHS